MQNMYHFDLRTPFCVLLFTLLSNCLWAEDSPNTDNQNRFIASNDITWTKLGKDENDSMPIGNGDLAANVWTEQNGDLVLLVAKADAWTELGKLVKLGRIRIKLNPNPFVDAADFTQVLKLENGTIEIKSCGNVVQIWVEANHPVLHVQADLDQPVILQAYLELWRTKIHPFSTPSPGRGGFLEFGGVGHTPYEPIPIDFETDTVLPARLDSVTWCHFNSASVYPIILQQEHLESLLQKYPDPLLHRCFGAKLNGLGLVSSNDNSLKSAVPGKNFRLDLYALTGVNAASPQAWQANFDTLVKRLEHIPLKQTWRAHQRWWEDFWNRSWIHVEGTPDAAKVSQGYAMQRYMMACSSRGSEPVKFNGGLFTIGHDMPENKDSDAQDHDPDFRKWGDCYWNQNNRLLYWPLIATGDYDLLKPWFNMYLDALPLAEDRTQLYHHHDGAAFPETMYFWGLPNILDFGWDNPTDLIQSEYQRYHIQGGVEVVAQMLDYYAYSQNAQFARSSLVPFADAIVTFYDQHWPHEANGKIKMSPTQSLETYQVNAVDPTPDIAGLYSVLPRLLALPQAFISQAQRNRWAKILKDLPAIPMGKTAHGKVPPFGIGDTNGTPIILPAEKYGKPDNVENPELYVAFPYRLYGVGKPDLEVARNTFAARLFPQDTCWGQDGTQAAILGLTREAQKVVISEFTDYGGQRYHWFWKAGNDWIPDLDDGGSGMITLQLMLMQCDGKRIQLLPAWPADWTADFKLHAPFLTTVEGHVQDGKATNLKVIPVSRAKDVVVIAPFGQPRQN